MLTIQGEARIIKSFKKTTLNGHTITDLTLKFKTSLALDKAKGLYRMDEVSAFIIGEGPSFSYGLGVDIIIHEAELRINTWTDKETNKPRSKPELLIKEWKIK